MLELQLTHFLSHEFLKEREREREREGWVQVTHDVTLKNDILSNNSLLNSYFKIFIFRLYVLYVLNMHINIHANQVLFTIEFINSSFMHYFKL